MKREGRGELEPVPALWGQPGPSRGVGQGSWRQWGAGASLEHQGSGSSSSAGTRVHPGAAAHQDSPLQPHGTFFMHYSIPHKP